MAVIYLDGVFVNTLPGGKNSNFGSGSSGLESDPLWTKEKTKYLTKEAAVSKFATTLDVETITLAINEKTTIIDDVKAKVAALTGLINSLNTVDPKDYMRKDAIYVEDSILMIKNNN